MKLKHVVSVIKACDTIGTQSIDFMFAREFFLILKPFRKHFDEFVKQEGVLIKMYNAEVDKRRKELSKGRDEAEVTKILDTEFVSRFQELQKTLQEALEEDVNVLPVSEKIMEVSERIRAKKPDFEIAPNTIRDIFSYKADEDTLNTLNHLKNNYVPSILHNTGRKASGKAPSCSKT